MGAGHGSEIAREGLWPVVLVDAVEGNEADENVDVVEVTDVGEDDPDETCAGAELLFTDVTVQRFPLAVVDGCTCPLNNEPEPFPKRPPDFPAVSRTSDGIIPNRDEFVRRLTSFERVPLNAEVRSASSGVVSSVLIDAVEDNEGRGVDVFKAP